MFKVKLAYGDIVIACVDAGRTMKLVFKDCKGLRLGPANKKYETIMSKSLLVGEALVSSVIRKLM